MGVGRRHGAEICGTGHSVRCRPLELWAGAPPLSPAYPTQSLHSAPGAQRDSLRQRHRQLLASHHESFHKVWGQLMKTGYQNSRYAHQVGGVCEGLEMIL